MLLRSPQRWEECKRRGQLYSRPKLQSPLVSIHLVLPKLPRMQAAGKPLCAAPSLCCWQHICPCFAHPTGRGEPVAIVGGSRQLHQLQHCYATQELSLGLTSLHDAHHATIHVILEYRLGDLVSPPKLVAETNRGLLSKPLYQNYETLSKLHVKKNKGQVA